MKKKITLGMLCLLACGGVVGQPAYSLQQLQDSAIQHNIAVKDALHDVQMAQQQRKEALTNFFPNVSATALWFNTNRGMAEMEIEPSKVIPQQIQTTVMPILSQVLPAEMLAALSNPMSISMMKKGTIAGVTAIQPVFAGGQIINGNKLAKVGEDVSQIQLRRAENDVLKNTQQYYWQYVTLNEKMKTVLAALTLLSDIEKDVDLAVKVGVAMNNDLLQVRLRKNEVESQKLKLNNGIGVVKMLMAQYCGLSDTMFVVSADMPRIEDITLPAQVSTKGVLPQVPEYQLLNKQVEATKLQHKMEVGKNLPTVGVGAGYNYHNLLERDHTFGMIFATVNVPISGWWGGSHAISRKKIAYQKAQDELNDRSQLLEIRMHNAWNGVQEAYQQLLLAQSSVEQANENLRLNRDYYRVGTTKMSDLLEAQMLFQQAMDKKADAVADYFNKVLEYQQAVGE